MGLREVNHGYRGFGFKYRKGIPVLVIGLVFIGVYSILASTQPEPSGLVILQVGNLTNMTNQTAGQAVDAVNETADAPRPDLVVTSLEFDGDLAFGTWGTITARVKNQGLGEAMPFKLETRANGELVETTAVAKLASGQEQEVAVVWEFPPLTEAVIEVTADPGDTINESKEDNNRKSRTYEQDKIRDGANMTEFRNGFTESWFSDRYFEAPDVDQYFSLAKSSETEFYLNIAVAGFDMSQVNQIATIKIPVPSGSGWSYSETLGETASSGQGIWNGPIIKIKFYFDGNNLVAEDQYGNKEKLYVGAGHGSITGVELVGAERSVFPTAIKPFRPLGAPTPDKFIPLAFFEAGTQSIFYYPMRWNPRTQEAEAYLRAQLLIKTA